MSIANLKPTDVPAELRMKIEKVMKRQKISWKEAIIFLARKVVSPTGRKPTQGVPAHFFGLGVVSPT